MFGKNVLSNPVKLFFFFNLQFKLQLNLKLSRTRFIVAHVCLVYV